MRSLEPFLAWLAIAALGCAASAVGDDPAGGDGGISCPPEQPAETLAANCHAYCDIYRCLGCLPTAEACEEACNAANPDAGAAQIECLACATKHINEVASDLTCTNDYGLAISGGEPFVLFFVAYPIDDCPVCVHNP